MARDVLAVLVSTIASESVFSIEDRILDPFRVHSLLSWFKTLFVLKIGFRPCFQFLFHKSNEALENEFDDLGNMFNFQTF